MSAQATIADVPAADATLIFELLADAPHATDEQEDPHERSTIHWVAAGDVIANARPATEADTDTPRLSLGDGVQLYPADNVVRATCAGRLTVHHRRISVQTSLVIDGNVDFHVGNIHCPTEILIRGDVADLFKVHGGASIEVKGVIEAAEVIAEGDLHAKGGISGKDKGHCRAGGSIDAKYILNGHVEAGGKVAAKMITNSRVICRGEVHVAGPIVSSHITSSAGVECRSLGADADRKTIVEVGIDQELRTLAARHVPIILEQQKKAQKICETVGPFLKNTSRLTPQQKQWAVTLLAEAKTLETSTSSLLAKLRELHDREQQNLNGWVRVNNGLFPGTEIHFPGLVTTIDKPVSHMVQIVCRHIENETKICLLYGNSGAPHPLNTRSCVDEMRSQLRKLLHPHPH